MADRVQEIRDRFFNDDRPDDTPPWKWAEPMCWLLAEVERLRAEIDRLQEGPIAYG